MLEQDKIKEAPSKDAFLRSLRSVTRSHFVMFKAVHGVYILRIAETSGDGNVYNFKGVDNAGNEYNGCYDFEHRAGWIDRHIDLDDK